MIGFLDTLRTPLGITGNYSTTAILHPLQFAVSHALGFSDFTSRILATGLWQSHCHFKSHMKHSFPSLIPFLSIFCNCQFRRLDSILNPLLRRSYSGRLASQNSTQFFSTEPLFITTLDGPCRKHSLPIVRKACLKRRCIATEVTRLLLEYSLPQEYVYQVVA
jgi:hypothetical protein